MPSTWPGICLIVFLRDSWLHRPPTGDLTGWNFFKSSCHTDYTLLANKAGWQVAGDLVQQESLDKSRWWVFVYIYDVVISLLLAGKNLEAGTIKVAKGTKGTCRTGTGMSAYRSGLLLPPGSKIDSFEISIRLYNCDRY